MTTDTHTTDTPHVTATIASIDAWLADKNCTLWSDWDVSRDDRRELAARWFHGQVMEWFEHRKKAAIEEVKGEAPQDRMSPSNGNGIRATTGDYLTPAFTVEKAR